MGRPLSYVFACACEDAYLRLLNLHSSAVALNNPRSGAFSHNQNHTSTHLQITPIYSVPLASHRFPSILALAVPCSAPTPAVVVLRRGLCWTNILSGHRYLVYKILCRIEPSRRTFPNLEVLCSGWRYRNQSGDSVGSVEGGELSLRWLFYVSHGSYDVQFSSNVDHTLPQSVSFAQICREEISVEGREGHQI